MGEPLCIGCGEVQSRVMADQVNIRHRDGAVNTMARVTWDAIYAGHEDVHGWTVDDDAEPGAAPQLNDSPVPGEASTDETSTRTRRRGG